MDSTPSAVITAAAFRPSGGFSTWTPFDTASTPVRAVQRQLYGLTILMVGAVGAVEVVSAPSGVRTAVRCAFVLIRFAAMAAWVRANRVALDQQNWCACAGKSITVRVIASRRPERQPVPTPPPISASDQWLLDEEQVEEASVL